VAEKMVLVGKPLVALAIGFSGFGMGLKLVKAGSVVLGFLIGGSGTTLATGVLDIPSWNVEYWQVVSYITNPSYISTLNVYRPLGDNIASVDMESLRVC